MHPSYNDATMDYDIALLQLSTAVEYNAFTSPISMLRSGDFAADTLCVVTGWGLTRESGQVANKLREAKVPIIGRSKCMEMYSASGITERMVCAGYADGKVDSCQGDSGGPLACPKNGTYVLAGVVSWGIGCGKKNKPGVYVNINNDEIRSWIVGVMTES